MADMVGFLQLGDDFGLFWPTLANGVSHYGLSCKLCRWLEPSCHADVLASLHDLAQQSSHVVDEI